MTILYIRHAEKAHKNGERNAVFAHDPELTKNGKLKSIEYGKELVEKYGPPNVIYSSPFERTRQTMNCLASSIPDITNLRSYSCNDLSEFLGNWKPHQVKLRPETAKCNPPICDHKTFEENVARHIEEFKKIDHSNLVIWVITHRKSIREIAKNFELPIKVIPYLGTLEITADWKANYLFE